MCETLCPNLPNLMVIFFFNFTFPTGLFQKKSKQGGEGGMQ